MEPTEVEKLQQAKQVFKTRTFNRQQLEYILGRKLTNKTWQATYLRPYDIECLSTNTNADISQQSDAPPEANVNRRWDFKKHQHQRPFASGASLSTRDLMAQTMSCRFLPDKSQLPEVTARRYRHTTSTFFWFFL